MLSLSRRILSDSQCPILLVSLAPISVIGRSQPKRLSTRVNALLPARCIPRTSKHVRRDDCGARHFANLLLKSPPNSPAYDSRGNQLMTWDPSTEHSNGIIGV